MNLASFHFIRPWCLLIVPVAALLWWWSREAKDPMRVWRRVLSPHLLDAMTLRDEPAGSQLRQLFPLAAWILSAVAIAGPTWRPEPSPFADDPVPVMIVLKTAETMALEDLPPSRMERARLKVIDFANERTGQPLGLIAYAGSAHLVLPPTKDTSIVATMAAELSPDVMPKPGDDLVAAIELAEATFQDAPGAIVVVTDSVASEQLAALEAFRNKPSPVLFFAITQADTPELDSIKSAAKAVAGDVTLMTVDDKDITALAQQAARVGAFLAVAGSGTRWAEDGWWLVPLIALLALPGFRRKQREQDREEPS